MDRKIKTRQVHKDIKVLDKTVTVTDHIKQSYVRTKENVMQSTEKSSDRENNPVGYAEDAASEYADRIFHETGHQVRRQAGKIIERKKEKAYNVSRKEGKTMPFILQTSGLSKKIGSKALVTDVNIHIPKGEIYGFLGPNGAGKTTVMKMITNLWKPTSGTIEVFGEVLTPKSYEVLKRMGSIIEFPTFYDHMTGRENLQLHCEYMGYYNVDSVESALQMLDLTSAADQPVKNYSLGMKERLGIARAIMCKPELLILDEPTNGLDPAGMKQIRDLLKTLCSEYGITVMISSHILSEVESIADTVAIIHHGKMMKEIRMQDIEEMKLNYVELSVTDEKRAAYVLTEKLGLQNFKILDSGKIRIYDHAASTQQLTKILALNDVEVVSIGKKSETLEDYFLKLTGEVKYHA